MAFHIRISSWTLIFILRLRFPPGKSIATSMSILLYVTQKILKETLLTPHTPEYPQLCHCPENIRNVSHHPVTLFVIHTCIEYGSKIYERKCAELERLREQSLVEHEERIWGLANEDKEQAVKETYEQGQEELKKFEEYAKKEKVGQLN